MTIYGFIIAAVIIAQVVCVADMVLRGRTLRMPVAGGALTVISKQESAIGFYALLAVWIVLFVGIDLIIFWPSR